MFVCWGLVSCSHSTPLQGGWVRCHLGQVAEQRDTVAGWDPGWNAATVEMTFIAKTFYDLRATTLEGDSVDFNVLRGRVVLIENVASLWGTTPRDYSELNQLQTKYPHRLVVLGFPCNQFGYQVSWAAWSGLTFQPLGQMMTLNADDDVVVLKSMSNRL